MGAKTSKIGKYAIIAEVSSAFLYTWSKNVQKVLDL